MNEKTKKNKKFQLLLGFEPARQNHLRSIVWRVANWATGTVMVACVGSCTGSKCWETVWIWNETMLSWLLDLTLVELFVFKRKYTLPAQIGSSHEFIQNWIMQLLLLIVADFCFLSSETPVHIISHYFLDQLHGFDESQQKSFCSRQSILWSYESGTVFYKWSKRFYGHLSC